MQRVFIVQAMKEMLNEDDLLMVDCDDAHEGMTQIWRLFLAMAVRDRASSVHFHSWLDGGQLSYISNWKRYSFNPPPEECKPYALSAAGNLLSSKFWGVIKRFIGRHVTGQFRLECEYGTSQWAGVCWSAKGVHGVEFYRLDPIYSPTTVSTDSEDHKR